MAPTDTPRGLGNEQVWRYLCHRFRASDLSVLGFCDLHRLPVATFYS
jgi:hypothetical protein